MPVINVGRVRLLWKGAYNEEQSYDFFDAVSYNGGSYMVNVETGAPVGTLPTNTDYWVCLASRGNQGPQGEKGEDGDKGLFVGQLIFSLLPIVDQGVHLLDGSVLAVGGIYDAFIKKIAAVQAVSPQCFITEEQWQEQVTLHGSCGKFVYTPGVSLRLPKISDIISCTYDANACGELVVAGLPDATVPVVDPTSSVTNVGGNATGAGEARLARLSDTNPIFGSSDTVTPQQVRGLVYIAVASSEKEDIQVDIDKITVDLGKKVDRSEIEEILENKDKSSTRFVGEIFHSLIPLVDAGVHLLDGAVLPAGGVYDEFVQYMASVYGQYLSVFVSEAEWQQSVNTYGSCGKFVLTFDEDTNKAVSVRLPKVSSIVQGTTSTSACGDLIEAGLPNITAFFGTAYMKKKTTGTEYSPNDIDVSGAIKGVSGWGVNGSTATTSAWFMNGTVQIDASLASPVYGNSTTVQPQTIKGLLYIVVATTKKTDIEVDIDKYITDLNNKVDMEQAAHSAMPGDSFVTLSVSGLGIFDYVAPSDGYFHTTVYALTGQTLLCNMFIVNTTLGTMVSGVGTSKLHLPAKKGDVVTINYGAGIDTSKTILRFIPCVGAQ